MLTRKHLPWPALLVALFFLAIAGTLRAQSSEKEPVLERHLWNVNVATSANVFTSSLTPAVTTTGVVKLVVYRVWIQIDALGSNAVVHARYTNLSIPGTPSTTFSQASNGALNGGTALTAGSIYAFDVPCTSSESLNFRTGTETIFRKFLVARIGESSQ